MANQRLSVVDSTAGRYSYSGLFCEIVNFNRGYLQCGLTGYKPLTWFCSNPLMVGRFAALWWLTFLSPVDVEQPEGSVGGGREWGGLCLRVGF